MSVTNIKCVVVGDGTVGKTCLLVRYARDEYSDKYIPTTFDNHVASVTHNGENYHLHLYDTAGQEEYEQLRQLAYTNTDILLVCFAIDMWSSFSNIRDLWVPELKKWCPEVPFILVGTKCDLRNNQKVNSEYTNLIGKDVGEKLAKEFRAAGYMECSAITKVNVNNVFNKALDVAILENNQHSDSHKQNFCSNLTRRCIVM